jgi:hypothetical protein
VVLDWMPRVVQNWMPITTRWTTSEELAIRHLLETRVIAGTIRRTNLLRASRRVKQIA